MMLLLLSTDSFAGVFADVESINTETSRATGFLAGTAFVLESTRLVPLLTPAGVVQGGVIGGTVDGTSDKFSSGFFSPSQMLGDDIQLGAVSDYRLTFSDPVSGLSLHIFQLASNRLTFSSQGILSEFELISSDGDFDVLNGGASIVGGDDAGGDNASGTLLFSGLISELSWTATNNNTNDGIFLQMSIDSGTVPTSPTYVLFILGFIGLRVAKERFVNVS